MLLAVPTSQAINEEYPPMTSPALVVAKESIITREYRDQTKPVAARDADWVIDKFSTGRFKSPNPAITKL
uniref:SFRICE_026749 n=1 Tax=Spodoptera frugiperda TaxID=7108 RepID=A0A2H1WJC0_SPOFR